MAAAFFAKERQMTAKLAFIGAESAHPTSCYPVRTMCRWLHVSTSGFYDRLAAAPPLEPSPPNGIRTIDPGIDSIDRKTDVINHRPVVQLNREETPALPIDCGDAVTMSKLSHGVRPRRDDEVPLSSGAVQLQRRPVLHAVFETDRSRRPAKVSVHVQAAFAVGRGTDEVRRVHGVLLYVPGSSNRSPSAARTACRSAATTPTVGLGKAAPRTTKACHGLSASTRSESSDRRASRGLMSRITL